MQILAERRLGFERIAATAMDGNGLVFGMNIRLHIEALSKKSEQRDDKFFMVLNLLLPRKIDIYFGGILPAPTDQHTPRADFSFAFSAAAV